MESDSTYALRALQSLRSLHGLRAALPAAAHSFPGYDWWLLVALVVSLLLAAAASAAETSLTSVSHIRIRNLAEEGDATAQRIQRVLERPDVFLSTILIVSNVAVITASTLATIIAVNLDFTGAEVASTILLSLLVLIFCEITPKTAAVQAPERWARLLIVPIDSFSTVLRPVVVALTWITSGILRVFGVESKRRGPFFTEDELRLMVEVGEEQGVLEEDERDMIHNVFDLADTAVREIMIPRIDMVTAKINDSVQAATQLIIQGGQSRIPVYDEASADIVGVLYAKDLLRVLASQRPDAPPPQVVRDLPLREPYFVPESKRLDDLLHEMQRQRMHIAIVVDEYGSVDGLVTIEDLVEEIIGDIRDEYDKDEQIFEQVGPNEYIVDAKISLDEFNELTEEELTSDEYDTLGGLVYAQLDKIPTVGDVVTYGDITITVLGTKGRRITKVKVVRAAPGEQPPATPSAPASSQTGRDERRRDDLDHGAPRADHGALNGHGADGHANWNGPDGGHDDTTGDEREREREREWRDGAFRPNAAPGAAPHSSPLRPTGAVGAATMAITSVAEAARSAPLAAEARGAAHVASTAPDRAGADGEAARAGSATPTLPRTQVTLATSPAGLRRTNGATGARPANAGENRSATRYAVPQSRGQQQGASPPQNGGDRRQRPGERAAGGRRQQHGQGASPGQSARSPQPSRPQPSVQSQAPGQPQRTPAGARIASESDAQPTSNAAPNAASPPSAAHSEHGRARRPAPKPGQPPNGKAPTRST